jgi:hypothetical protein
MEVVRRLPVAGNEVCEDVGEFDWAKGLLLFAMDVEFPGCFEYASPRRKGGGS